MSPDRDLWGPEKMKVYQYHHRNIISSCSPYQYFVLICCRNKSRSEFDSYLPLFDHARRWNWCATAVSHTVVCCNLSSQLHLNYWIQAWQQSERKSVLSWIYPISFESFPLHSVYVWSSTSVMGWVYHQILLQTRT